MVTFEQAGDMLDKAAQSFPPVFFSELNGGIMLLPDVKRRRGAGRRGLYILGEYCVSPSMGKYIAIYYGSFVRVYGELSAEAFERKLYETLRHEFTHHMEVMAGEDSLAKKDEAMLQ